MRYDRESVRRRLFELAEPSYMEFSSALSPGEEKMLGVRLPALRGMAKEICRGDWRRYLADAGDEYFEEIMLSGFVTGLCRCSLSERLALVGAHIPKIRGWSLCDSFCAGLKFAKEHPGEVYEFILPCLASPEEYRFRFGVVMLLFHYMNGEFADRVLPIIFSLSHPSVYGRLAIAWAAAEAAAKLPQKAVPMFFKNGLDDKTLALAVRKARESRRVSPEDKAALLLALELRAAGRGRDAAAL